MTHSGEGENPELLTPEEYQVSLMEKQLSLLQESLMNTQLQTMALMQMAGIGRMRHTGEGGFEFIPYTDEERQEQPPPPRMVPTARDTSTRLGAEGPIAWVFYPPASYSDVEIVCSPHTGSPLGFLCEAIRKMGHGMDPKKYAIQFMEKE